LICSFGVLIFDGLPRLFLLSSPLTDGGSSFSFFGATTTFFIGAEVFPVLGGRPRARFPASELLLAFVETADFAEPADFGGRPRPFFAPALTDDDALFSPSS